VEAIKEQQNKIYELIAANKMQQEEIRKLKEEFLFSKKV